MATAKEALRNAVPLPQQLQPAMKLEKGSSFLPMLHGKGTDELAKMAGEKITENKLNNTGVVVSGEVKLVLDKFNELTGTLGVSTDKLLRTAIAFFTELNHTGSNDKKLSQTAVTIPLKDYALRCGYDVEAHETATPEEAEIEAKRAENALKNARKKINKDLAIMFASSLSWKEKVRGKQADYMDIRLIEAKGIRNGNICIKFTQLFAEYLISLPQTKYPVALLAVDERNNNAYNMGLKMTIHYNMDNNQIKETAQLLKVRTLLECTTLPTLADCKRLRRPWAERVKEPFENALDALTACKLLEDWRYSHSKGVELTDEEATNFSSFDEWADTLVYFTLADAPDHKARLERKSERLEQAKKGKKKKTSKKKKPDTE